MVDGCSALQMADVLRAAGPPAAELYVLACVESHMHSCCTHSLEGI